MVLGEQSAPVISEAPAPELNHQPVLLAHDLVHRERHRGERHVEHDVEVVAVDPLAHDAGADVGLVLVVGGEDPDVETGILRLEVGGGHLGRHHRALAGEVGIGPGPVVQHPEGDAGGAGGVCLARVIRDAAASARARDARRSVDVGMVPSRFRGGIRSLVAGCSTSTRTVSACLA